MYLLFSNLRGETEGGMNEYIGRFDTIQEAKDEFKDSCALCQGLRYWAEIVEHATMKVVWIGESPQNE